MSCLPSNLGEELIRVWYQELAFRRDLLEMTISNALLINCRLKMLEVKTITHLSTPSLL